MEPLPEASAAVTARVRRLAALARRPDVVVRLVVGAARVLFPGARVDVLLREPKRRWTTRACRPRPPLQALDGGGGAGAPGTRRSSPQPPESTLVRDLRVAGVEFVGDEDLLRSGLAWRLVAPMRLPEVRGVLSVAREGPGFSDADVAAATELSRVLAPALAAEARVQRALRSVERARFVQHLTAHVNRSLEAEDVLRALGRHLARRIAFDRIEIVHVAQDGKPDRVSSLDAATGLRDVVSRDPAPDDVIARAIASREPAAQPDLAQLAAASPGESALRDEGLRCRVLLPLVARRRVVGVVVLLARRADGIGGDALSLLRHVARPVAVALENARLYLEASTRSRRMTALYEVGQALNSAADVRDVTDRVLWILHDTFSFQHSAVLTLERDGQDEWLVVQASRGYSLREGEGAFRIPVGQRGITSRAVRTGRLVYVPDVRRDPDYVQGVELGRSEVAVPLLVGGHVIGVLDIESTKVDAFSEEDLATVRLFSTQVAMALDRARAFEEIRRQAMTDSLTGLLNQRYFQQKVARELSRSQRTGRPFVLCLLDIDDFKLINDRHGHVGGNQVIARLGEVLARRIRSIDAAARFGGDEFAMILSETNAVSALTIVSELQDELRQGIPGIDAIRISVGIGEWHPGLSSVRDVVALADGALYRAKREGKDRACIAEPSKEGREEALSS